MNNNLISVSGKINSGKDLITSIIRILTHKDETIRDEFYDNPIKTLDYYDGILTFDSLYDNTKFAHKLKVIVSNLLGCTVNELEKNSFKNVELPPNWWYYLIDNEKVPYLTTDLTDLERSKNKDNLVKLTPRRLLQLMGTEAGRGIIHPDVWVNGLFIDYVEGESKWVISDLRFLNELNKVKSLDGLSIRVFRYKKISEWFKTHNLDFNLCNIKDRVMSDVEFTNYINGCDLTINKELFDVLNHTSETEIDDEEYVEIIKNDGTVIDLINRIYYILVKHSVINEVKNTKQIC